MTEAASLKPQTKAGYFALLKEMTAEPQSDLKRVTVSMLCIEHGLDERYRSEAIDRITRNVEKELEGVQSSTGEV